MDEACSTYGVDEKFRRVLMEKAEGKRQFYDIFLFKTVIHVFLLLCLNTVYLCNT
jgi:hypothetical protein